MLGDCVTRYFKQQGHDVTVVGPAYPTEEFKVIVKEYNGDAIVNCIGGIHQRTNNFQVNMTLPFWLEKNSACHILYPGTDCDNDDTEYGISKRVAIDWIESYAVRTKVIRASILGFDREGKSLLSWVLTQDDSRISGYTDYMWNGVTTLKWAQYAEWMLKNWYMVPTKINLTSDQVISKCELIKQICIVFQKELEVVPFDRGLNEDKSLKGYNTSPIDIQLGELKRFYDANHLPTSL